MEKFLPKKEMQELILPVSPEKMEKEIAALPKVSDAPQAYARALNKYVHDEAVYYIDYVM